MIDKFIGDEVMVIFGAPIAHENDPERAVRCALEMMEYIEQFNTISPVKLPSPLGIHIGLNSGLVIAGNVGSDLRMNYSVIGDTVNLAARLVSLASTGEIKMSQNTYKMVSDLTKVHGPTLTKIKGKKKPVEVYKLLSLKEKAEVISSKAVGELVGRMKEKETYRQALDLVLDKKEKRLFIQGEAGVGKTRLKEDLIQKANSKGISIYEGQCSSFDTNTPYYLWNSLLKNILHISSETTEGETRKLLHDALQILHLETDEPYLATLLSLRYEEILLEEDQERKRKIYEAVVKLLKAYAKKSPTLFIFEDLHWIDRFSQELLEYVFSQEKLGPALFVSIYRPEYMDVEKIKSQGELLDLDRLSGEESEDLMKLRFGTENIPESIIKLIRERSEGNPFFIEEIIKTLQEKEIISVKRGKVRVLEKDIEAGVPDTIHGVIMARIDRLEERIREVFLSASVVGREFSRSVLEHVADDSEGVLPSLNQLKGLELVLEKEEAKELEYLFKHYLIQEVAYNTILIEKRKRLHKLIADAIESLYEDNLKDYYELLSFHYEKAEEWEKAAEYLSRAGRKVREIYTNEESKEFFERKETAMEKLFEAESAKRGGWFLLSKFMAVISVILVVIIGFTMFRATQEFVSFIPILFERELLTVIRVLVFLLVIGVSLPLGILMFAYFGVLQYFRSQPRLFELFDDRLQVVLKSGNTYTVHFSDIHRLQFYDEQMRKSRPLLLKLLDPFGVIAGDNDNTLKSWINKMFTGGMPPYSFGFGSKQGEILIVRKSGIESKRFYMPWKNTPEYSKFISISPAHNREFFRQLKISFLKWSGKDKTKRSRVVISEKLASVLPIRKRTALALLLGAYIPTSFIIWLMLHELIFMVKEF